MTKQKYPHEVIVPQPGEIIIFRNKNNGHRYYKRSDDSIVKMDDELNGETFNIYEKNISSVINDTEDIMDILDTDDGKFKRSGIDLVTVKFCCRRALAISKSDLQGLSGGRGATGAQGPAGPAGPQGIPGVPGGVSEFADFFALMPGDNAATVAIGGDVDFPQDGPAVGGITRLGVDSFELANPGIYEVNFQVSVTEPGQLALTLNNATLLPTVVGRATGTSQIVGLAIIDVPLANSVLTVRNDASAAALTITPLAGGTNPVSAHLVIKRLA